MSTEGKKPGTSAGAPKKTVAKFAAAKAETPVAAPVVATPEAVPAPAAILAAPEAPVAPAIVAPAAAPAIAPPAAEASAQAVATATLVPSNVTPIKKELFPMATAVQDTVETVNNTVTAPTEQVVAQSKAAYEQMSSKAREAIEKSVKSNDEFTAFARGNVEAMMASNRAATQGLETIAHQIADLSRKNFEATTAAARSMTAVKTPNELMQLHSDFTKTQFDTAVTEFSKLSETVVKVMGEVVEPLSNRFAVAVDKIGKTATVR